MHKFAPFLPPFFTLSLAPSSAGRHASVHPVLLWPCPLVLEDSQLRSIISLANLPAAAAKFSGTRARTLPPHPVAARFLISPLAVKSPPLTLSHRLLITPCAAVHVRNCRGAAKGLKSQSAH